MTASLSLSLTLSTSFSHSIFLHHYPPSCAPRLSRLPSFFLSLSALSFLTFSLLSLLPCPFSVFCLSPFQPGLPLSILPGLPFPFSFLFFPPLPLSLSPFLGSVSQSLSLSLFLPLPPSLLLSVSLFNYRVNHAFNRIRPGEPSREAPSSPK